MFGLITAPHNSRHLSLGPPKTLPAGPDVPIFASRSLQKATNVTNPANTQLHLQLPSLIPTCHTNSDTGSHGPGMCTLHEKNPFSANPATPHAPNVPQLLWVRQVSCEPRRTRTRLSRFTESRSFRNLPTYQSQNGFFIAPSPVTYGRKESTQNACTAALFLLGHAMTTTANEPALW